MSSFYVVEPGQENHFHHFSGRKSTTVIKVGIFGGNEDPGTYTYRRYMGGTAVHLGIHRKDVRYRMMEKIERRVLHRLKTHYGYKKQHGKKEHFIIPANNDDISLFVARVSMLYAKYISQEFS